jgi:hypothetical protein
LTISVKCKQWQKVDEEILKNQYFYRFNNFFYKRKFLAVIVFKIFTVFITLFTFYGVKVSINDAHLSSFIDSTNCKKLAEEFL